MTIDSLIKKLKRRNDLGKFVHHEVIEKRRPGYQRNGTKLDERIRSALTDKGITRLYSHQEEAIDLIRGNKNVVVMTPTASGKSLIYNIPVLESVLDDSASHALYLFPLKGLAQDQLKALDSLTSAIGLKNAAAIYDGDTSQHARKKIRENPPSVVLSNPDMLHQGICPYHPKWEKFFSRLRYVVIDEIHTYRGVLGSNMAELIRRLNRICSLYGSAPTIIACSATIANPGELANSLTGLDFEVVEESGAPMGKRNFLFVNPIPHFSPYTVSTKIFTDCVKSGFKTIAFTKARKITELIHTWAREGEPGISKIISSYRAGYLPEERRAIESRLIEGTLGGVISTSALELGVDIGGLDVCVLVGYPGTISSTWQRAGRVGRKGRDSLIVLVAIEDALDQHFMRHPEDFFRRSVEAAVIDETNYPILKAHLLCAAAEAPIGKDERAFDMEIATPVLEALKDEGRLWYSRVKYTYNPKRRYPHREVSIRGTGSVYRIINVGDGRMLGESGAGRILRDLHPGAIYLHMGEQYIVKSINIGSKEVRCASSIVNYHTSPITDESTEILESVERQTVHGLELFRGRLRITEDVLGYRKKDIATRKVLSEHTLELPSHVFETTGVWMRVEDDIIDEAREMGYNVAGGLHALEHSAIAALPLYALCDRTDLGGVSYYPINPELEAPAIFIYDGHEGGVGLTERGFELAFHWINSTLRLIEDCDCELSCPSCTQDPHCGNNNEPLDKRAAILILKKWLRA